MHKLAGYLNNDDGKFVKLPIKFNATKTNMRKILLTF